MLTQIAHVGEGIGRIKNMSMGIKYTSVDILEDIGGIGLTHTIMVTNSVAWSLRMGMRVKLTLEIHE